jgi:prepilin-type N-terminal cleavage/methylation domain-containing protein
MKNKAFTLIELLVVIAIIGLLASIVVVNVNSARDKAKIAKLLQYSSSVYHALGVNAAGVWNFDNNALDYSSNGNNCVLNGGASYSSDTPYSQANQGAGKYSLLLNGSTAYADCSNGSLLKNMTNSVTVEAWAKYSAYGGGGQSYSVIAVKGEGNWTFLMENPSNKIRFRVTAGGADNSAQDPQSHELNKWYHFVGTYDGSYIRMYKDGALVASTSQTGNLAVSDYTVKIGTFQGTNYNFNGLIDDVRVYSLALSQAEIQKHYAEGLLKHQFAKQ